MTRLVVIGGSDAGISAGLRAHELDPTIRPQLLLADAYPNFSICGIPYHVSGDVPDWRSLAHRTGADLLEAGLDLWPNTRAVFVDPDRHNVTLWNERGTGQLTYDKLVIATGAAPVRPPIEGPDDGVHLLHTMDDTFALTKTLDRGPRSAVIVGAGYIGLEMVEALHACATTKPPASPQPRPPPSPTTTRRTTPTLERSTSGSPVTPAPVGCSALNSSATSTAPSTSGSTSSPPRCTTA
jgi:NADH dehydrogenase FAD-containing subunit